MKNLTAIFVPLKSLIPYLFFPAIFAPITELYLFLDPKSMAPIFPPRREIVIVFIPPSAVSPP